MTLDIYCYNGIIRGKEKRKTPLHSSKWRDILSQLDKYGIRKITVTGGEPLLYKDSFSEILSEWKAKGNSIDLITNGTMIEECDIETLKSIYNSITISIDSHVEDVANSLRNHTYITLQ